MYLITSAAVGEVCREGVKTYHDESNAKMTFVDASKYVGVPKTTQNCDCGDLR